MIKRILSVILVIFMTIGVAACSEGKIDNKTEVKKIPDYTQKEFGLSGYWAPYEISEESLKLYKEVGFNTLLMINHSLDNTSEEQFYLGSERTMNALELCKKLGLKATLNYNDWKAEQVEGAG